MAEGERVEGEGRSRRGYDLTGQRFARLTALVEAGRSRDRKILWLCRCECGKQVTVSGKRLRNGESKSCGCLQAELTAARNRSHGHTGTRLYRIWKGMLRRCMNPNDRRFEKYGGRGVAVCDRWRSFENFHADMADGYADHLTIDRIDVEGDYEPGNCRWATQTEQQRNRTNNLMVTHEGATKPLAEWCEQLGLPYRPIAQRLRVGWSVERAFATPVRVHVRKQRPRGPHPYRVAS